MSISSGLSKSLLSREKKKGDEKLVGLGKIYLGEGGL